MSTIGPLRLYDLDDRTDAICPTCAIRYNSRSVYGESIIQIKQWKYAVCKQCSMVYQSLGGTKDVDMKDIAQARSLQKRIEGSSR